MWHLDLLVFNFCGSLFSVLQILKFVAESCADLGCHLEIERQPGPSYASEFTALGGRGNRTNNVRTNIENLYLRCGGTRSNLISRLGPTRMMVYRPPDVGRRFFV